MRKLKIKYDNTTGLIFIGVDKNTSLDLLIGEKEFAITVPVLSFLLKTLLLMEIISPSVLLGVLEEYNTYNKELRDG